MPVTSQDFTDVPEQNLAKLVDILSHVSALIPTNGSILQMNKATNTGKFMIFSWYIGIETS